MQMQMQTEGGLLFRGLPCTYNGIMLLILRKK